MNSQKFYYQNTIGLLGVITLSILCQFLSAQSVGIGTTTPNTFSMLDISSSNKGLLLPRIALTSTIFPM